MTKKSVVAAMLLVLLTSFGCAHQSIITAKDYQSGAEISIPTNRPVEFIENGEDGLVLKYSYNLLMDGMKLSLLDPENEVEIPAGARSLFAKLELFNPARKPIELEAVVSTEEKEQREKFTVGDVPNTVQFIYAPIDVKETAKFFVMVRQGESEIVTLELVYGVGNNKDNKNQGKQQ